MPCSSQISRSRGRKSRGGDDEPALALQRLDDDRGDAVGRHGGREEVLDARHPRGDRAALVGAVVAVAEAVRVAHVVHPGQEGPHALAVLRLARGQGDRAVGAAVEAPGEGDDLGAPGGPPGQLDARPRPPRRRCC